VQKYLRRFDFVKESSGELASLSVEELERSFWSSCRGQVKVKRIAEVTQRRDL
jgi:hypothetical protein